MELQEIINDIDKRLKALEHTVNEVIIDGLKKANDSYIDDERYKVFSDTYGEMIAPYADSMKILCGEDYDLCRDLYNYDKEQEGYGSDGYDENGVITRAIESVKSKIAALKGVSPNDVEVKVEAKVDEGEGVDKKEEPEAEVEVKEEKEEDVPSDEQLMKEFKGLL